jgi:hypothetical protein
MPVLQVSAATANTRLATLPEVWAKPHEADLPETGEVESTSTPTAVAQRDRNQADSVTPSTPLP